jgi:hypothetical protein
MCVVIVIVLVPVLLALVAVANHLYENRKKNKDNNPPA